MIKDTDISLLYLTGHHGAGKSELSRYLVTKYRFGAVETGAMVRDLYGIRSSEYKNLSLGEFVVEIEAKFPGYFSIELASMVRSTVAEDGIPVIINGMRSYQYISELSERMKPHISKILWTEAPEKTLRKRYNTREGKNLSIVEFNNLMQFDIRLGISVIRDHADAVISNIGTIDAFRKRVENELCAWGLLGIR